MDENTTGFTSRNPAKGLAAGPVVVRDRVTDPCVGYGLDAGDQVPDLARPQGRHGHERQAEYAGLLHLVRRAVPPEPDGLACLETAFVDPHVDDDTTVHVVVGIEDQGLQWRIGIPRRWRNSLDDGLAQLVDPRPQLPGYEECRAGIQAQVVSRSASSPPRCRRWAGRSC